MALPSSENYDADEFAVRANVRSWLMDTGCKHDLTTRAAIPACQIDLITRAKNPILLNTASDLISIDKVVPRQFGELGETAEPTRFGSVARRTIDWAPLRSWRLRLPVVTVFVETPR